MKTIEKKIDGYTVATTESGMLDIFQNGDWMTFDKEGCEQLFELLKEALGK